MKQEINVLDIETFTDNNKVIPYCICLKLNNINNFFWYEHNMVNIFLDYIIDNTKSDHVVIYAHNINFDGLILIDFIKKKKIIFDMFIRGHNIYWIKINYCKIEITVRCSYKIIPLSIESLGNLINSKKKVFPYKFVNINNLEYNDVIPDSKYFNSIKDYNSFKIDYNFFNLKQVTIDYCFQDIEIIYVVLKSILEILFNYSKHKYNIINNSYSFSSISYKIYSKYYDCEKITNQINPIGIHNYIKNGYYGGRCEVFGNPNENEIVHYFDYKGMYAQCMMEKFPYGEVISKNNNLSLYNIGFHTIKFQCDSYLPYLPIKHNKLLFPNGSYVGTYWYEEILNAISNNKCKVIEHYSSIEFEYENYIFKDFVNEFMSIRDKGIYYNIFGKNMINGLYGSFALNDENELYIISISDMEYQSYSIRLDIISYKKIGDFHIIKVKKNEKSRKFLDKKQKWDFKNKKRNVAYAAIIASKARIKLNNSLNDVIKDGGRLFYTDTDSIFAGYKYNKLNHILNDIKWSEIYEDAVFISSKFYFIKNKDIKLKGINKNTYDFDNIKKNFYDKKSIMIFEDQNSFLRSNFEIFQHISNKKINISSYDKRIFTDDLKDSSPVNCQTYNI